MKTSTIVLGLLLVVSCLLGYGCAPAEEAADEAGAMEEEAMEEEAMDEEGATGEEMGSGDEPLVIVPAENDGEGSDGDGKDGKGEGGEGESNEDR